MLSLLLYGPAVFVISIIWPVLNKLITCEADSDAGWSSGVFLALSTGGSIAEAMTGSYWLNLFGAVTATVAAAKIAFAGVLGSTYATVDHECAARYFLFSPAMTRTGAGYGRTELA